MKKSIQIGFLMAYILVFSEVAAQERSISGKVTSVEDGSTLPGVNVVLRGTTAGTVTDIDGNYTLSIPSTGGVLVFSFIGLATEEVEIGVRSVVDVAMTADIKQLNEVVIVGYGEVDKRKLISSVASVSGEEISKMPVMSFDQALQGKAAGVQVTTTSGLLGEAPKIRIRGVNSISGGTDPLFVVDGVPIETGDFSGPGNVESNALADINPADIESYEVLKDGAATAIYGSRAANGVILITTKTGQAGKPEVNYNMFMGFNEAENRFDLLNADEFIRISNEKFAAAGIAPQAFPGPDNVDTDWQDEVLRRGFVQNHALSFKGGSEAVQYFVSLGYADQEGATVGNAQRRYSARANIDYNAKDWFSAGVKLQVSQQQTDNVNSGTGSLSGNLFNSLKAFPNVPVFDPDHPTGYNLTEDNQSLGSGNNTQNIAFNLPNIRYVLDNNLFESKVQRLLGNTYLQFNLPFDIELRTQLGIDVSDTRNFTSWNPIHGDGNPNGFVDRDLRNTSRWNWQNTLSWRKTVSDVHNFYIVAGTEYQKTTFDRFTGQGQGFSDPFFLEQGLITGSFDTQFSSGFYGEEGFSSLFGRLNYDYNNRYLVSLSIRNDAISGLPEDNRSDTFLGGSLGWNISQEDFFNVGFINQLKIRAGYAETGNDNLPGGLFPALGTYGPELYGDLTAIRFENVGNNTLVWETTSKYNVGLDFAVLNNRITGSIDYFLNDTEDLVLRAPTPPSLGIPGNEISQNVGALENRGVELAINSLNMETNGFTWSTSFNITFAQNEITSLANNNSDVIETYNILRVGEPIGALFGFIYNGVNPANGNPIYTKADGTLIQGNPDDNQYYFYNPLDPGAELSREEDLDLEQGDKVVLGQTNPKAFGGMTNNFSYKGFDFSFVLTYAFGQKVYNASRQDGLSSFFVNNISEIRNRWTPANRDTDVPRLSLENDNFLNLDGEAVSRFVEDGDYVRIQNISLGYSLPRQVLENIGFTRARIYAQVQNAFVFTGYQGLDPELNFSNTSNTEAGIDLNTNPLLRTYTMGLNLTF